MSGEFNQNGPSNPYDPEASGRNPYAPTRHSGPNQSANLVDDLLHQINDREFRLGDIFRVSARLYRRYLIELGGPALVYGLLFAVASYLLSHFTVDWMVGMMQTDPENVPTPESLLANLYPYWLEFTVLLLALLALQGTFLLYTTIRAGERCRFIDQAPPIPETMNVVFQRLAPYLLVSLFSYFMLLFGLVLCFLPGLVLAVYFSMLGPLIGIGGLGLAAIERSFVVLRNRFWKTLGVYVVLFCSFYIFAGIISFGFNAWIPQTVAEQIRVHPDLNAEEAIRLMFDSPAYHLSQLPSTIGGTILSSFIAVASTVMYMNYTRPDQKEKT